MLEKFFICILLYLRKKKSILQFLKGVKEFESRVLFFQCLLVFNCTATCNCGKTILDIKWFFKVNNFTLIKLHKCMYINNRGNR